jgi:hypothetical protein
MSSPLIMKEHSTLQLHCVWRPGVPPTAAKLTRNGKLLSETRGNNGHGHGHVMYVMEDIHCWQGGNVSCQADNASRNQSLIIKVICEYFSLSTGFNPFTASCENAMSLSVPGAPAPCEKFPHSSQLNFK